jgi:hypothetical protein
MEIKNENNILSNFENLKENKTKWKNFKEKYEETKTNIDLKNFEQIEKAVKFNGLDPEINLIYLKHLKNTKSEKFEEEFEQYKFTLKKEDRLNLSDKEEIKTNLKTYIENLFLEIIELGGAHEKENENEKFEFNFEKELKKFNINFNRFGFLINKNNEEIYYAFLIIKILSELNNIQKNQDIDIYYFCIKNLVNFFKTKNINTTKLLILFFIFSELGDYDADYYSNETSFYSQILIDLDEKDEQYLVDFNGYSYEINKKYFAMNRIKNIKFNAIKNKFKQLFKNQKIIDDNKKFIENSYYGKDFYFIYDFFKKVIRSKLLNFIYSAIEGFKDYLNEDIFKEIDIDKLILIPMFINDTTLGLNQNHFGYSLIDSLPKSNINNFYIEQENEKKKTNEKSILNKNEDNQIKNIKNEKEEKKNNEVKNKKKINVIYKIHNYFKLYTNILHEQGFHLFRNIIHFLNPEVSENSPKNVFINLTKDEKKKNLIKLEDNDGGDEGELILFGAKELNLKQIFYFSNIENYYKDLSQIEEDNKKLEKIDDITQEDIKNSFFNTILSDEEKNDLKNKNYNLKPLQKLEIIAKNRKNKSNRLEIGKKNDKKFFDFQKVLNK